MDETTRKARAKAAGYKFWLAFTREFLFGQTLAGTRHEDGLPFCRLGDGKAWVNAINARPARVGYKVISYRVVAL
jgi:hypothetical protein